MDPARWSESHDVRRIRIDMCAYGHEAQKPTDFWTSLPAYLPEGTTGDGRCHQRCEKGFWTEKGSYVHPVAFAQEPSRQPRGSKRCMIPPEWAREVLTEARKHATRDDQDVVIDLFCGYRSLAPVAKDLGLTYIGVDAEFRVGDTPMEG